MDYYQILDVHPQASASEIKRAYRRQAKLFHPDINSSPEAEIRIRQIREAYDTLIDPFQRNFYDLSRESGKSFDSLKEETVLSEREKARRAYRKKKAQEDRQRFEYLMHVRISFYRFQRKASYFFLIVAILFSIDYHLQLETKKIRIKEVKTNHYGDAYVMIDRKAIPTDKELYDLYDRRFGEVKVYYSSILHLPRTLVYRDQSFQVKSNLYIFNNAYAYIILIISIILIGEKNYHDWALTLGLVPWFFMIILSFLVLFDLHGVGY